MIYGDIEQGPLEEPTAIRFLLVAAVGEGGEEDVTLATTLL